MGLFKVFRKSWSLKRKLIFGLTVLTLVVLIPVLSINIRATSPAGTVENNAAGGDTSALVGDAAEADISEENAILFLPFVDWRDPEIAAKYGAHGYVEFSLKDAPQDLALSRGEEWSGTILVHFISYTQDLTETQVHLYPHGKDGRGGISNERFAGSGGLVIGKTYEGGFFDFTDLIDYNPSGTIVIGDGETLPIEMTMRIPADFPESIKTVPLAFMGIWQNTREVKLIFDSGTPKVIVR
jgi:hypothetical protein